MAKAGPVGQIDYDDATSTPWGRRLRWSVSIANAHSDQLQTHLNDFMAAYNLARRLKTLGGHTPYEYICKIWTSEPDRFILNPTHQMPGLNT